MWESLLLFTGLLCYLAVFCQLLLKSLSQGTIEEVPVMTVAITAKKLLSYGAWDSFVQEFRLVN